jgi:hypothetical protein
MCQVKQITANPLETFSNKMKDKVTHPPDLWNNRILSLSNKKKLCRAQNVTQL